MNLGQWLDVRFAELGAWLCGWGEPACMGGYGAFVWVATGVTVLALLINVLLPVFGHRKALAAVAAEAREREADVSMATSDKPRVELSTNQTGESS